MSPDAVILIFDIRGNQVLKQVTNLEYIDISGLVPGIYTIEILMDEIKTTGKFIKE